MNKASPVIDGLFKNFTPYALWKAFEEICTIPRPSGHETEIIKFLAKRGADAGLKTEIDKTGNLIVQKPATGNHQSDKGIILQSHVDMVPQANSSTSHDFTKDPIKPRVTTEQGEQWVKATGTTLGADNGIGVAAMLAIMEDTALEHAPLELVFTVEEETGLRGAMEMEAGKLNGSILINLDTEQDGDIVIGCAGGRDVTAQTPVKYGAIPKNHTALTINVTGLKGGHSGCDIHLGRGNAIRCLIRLLRTALTTSDNQMYIATISGGTARNAIPREAEAIFAVPSDIQDKVLTDIQACSTQLSQELTFADPDLKVSCETTSLPDQAILPKDTGSIIRALYASQDGISRLSDTLPNTPETSCNFGVIKNQNDHITTTHMVRSNVDSARDALCEQLSDTYNMLGSVVSVSPAYPGWKPNPNAQVLKTLSSIYETQNNTPANITTLHAGLECAILGAPYPHWEMASIGPTIRNPHSPDEAVHAESVTRFWNWLTAALTQAGK